MIKILAAAAVLAFVAWTWANDLLVALFFVMSLAAMMGGVALSLRDTDEQPEPKPSSRQAAWLSASGLVISIAILFSWWWSKDDLFTQCLFIAGLIMWLVVVVFGAIIVHDRRQTKPKLGKH